MRPEKNPLDLNNLPEDYSSRDHGKLVFEEGSSSGGGGGCRKKKSGGNNKEGKDECGKVYECRFCSLKFCKSQALGGHMNRHRQERETETLNRARQLVFSNDNLAAHAHGAPHLGLHPIAPGSYHPSPHLGDSFRSMYPPKLFSSSSSALIPPPPPLPPPQPQPPLSYPYPSTSRYPPNPINDYYVGHVLTTSSSHFPHHHHYMGSSSTSTNPESNYTCIGAPVGHGIGPGSSPGGSDMAGSPSGGGCRDGSLGNNQDEGLMNNNWGRSYRPGGANHPHHRLDPF